MAVALFLLKLAEKVGGDRWAVVFMPRMAFDLTRRYAGSISRAEPSNMSRAIIGRWGKNLAVRFPAEVATAAGLGDGELVEVIEQEGQVVIRKTSQSLTMEEMFRGNTPEAWRELYASAYDWDPDRGREIVDE